MRLFLAIELPQEVKDRIDELQSELRPRLSSARWVPPSNVHVTLRFLGETSAAVADRLGERLEREPMRQAPFVLKFRGVGAFPSSARPRVLWVGIHEAPEALFRLQSLVEEAARAEGFPRETRSFEPHLTIARFRHPDPALASLLSTMGEPSLGQMTASELVCVESRLSPAGASHRALGRFEIARTAGII